MIIKNSRTLIRVLIVLGLGFVPQVSKAGSSYNFKKYCAQALRESLPPLFADFDINNMGVPSLGTPNFSRTEFKGLHGDGTPELVPFARDLGAGEREAGTTEVHYDVAKTKSEGFFSFVSSSPATTRMVTDIVIQRTVKGVAQKNLLLKFTTINKGGALICIPESLTIQDRPQGSGREELDWSLRACADVHSFLAGVSANSLATLTSAVETYFAPENISEPSAIPKKDWAIRAETVQDVEGDFASFAKVISAQTYKSLFAVEKTPTYNNIDSRLRQIAKILHYYQRCKVLFSEELFDIYNQKGTEEAKKAATPRTS